MADNIHWRNKVEPMIAKSIEELTKKLNAFYDDKFVIATQVFPPAHTGTGEWTAIIYFKVAPELVPKTAETF